MSDDNSEDLGAGEFGPRWSVETLHNGYRQALEIADMLYDSETDHQRIRVFQSAKFGRVLTLDDVVQTTEADEFIYHEMLTHPALLAHGAAKRVLIVGGGDGGMLREVLKHPGVEHVTMVEIDAGVVEFSKRYLPSLSDGAFEDARLNLVIADGADFMKSSADSFDVVIIDSTDPIGPGETLFTDSFYAHAKARLTPSGVLVTQNGVPFLQSDELVGTLSAFKALFSDWTCYLATVPTYVGGPMAFGWASMDPAVRRVSDMLLTQRFKAAHLSTRYYTPEVHKAAFALPGYVQKLLP
ncbi:MAG: polyamine aminopropyltransferase [Rhodobacteraceae bacterium]|nr:polyamine aminopropyltransferase [Paracoccaceae bacterium]